jgi:DNA-binding CsgD family transcriptional regulator
MNSLFKEQDLQTLQGQSLEIIHGLEDSSDDRTYLLQKSPLRDANNQIIGLIYHCSSWSQPGLLNLLNKLDQKHQPSEAVQADYRVDENSNPLNLSKRELECLFLLLRGQTAQQTANVLQLSRRTIESYLNNMKNKFGCFNKSELLVKAMSLGYQKHLPKSLLNKNLEEIFK